MLENVTVAYKEICSDPSHFEIAKTCSRSRSGYIAFITGASESKRFLFDTARQQGLKVLVIDSNKSSGLTLLRDGTVDYFIPVELSTESDIAARQCVSALKDSHLPVIGIVTFMEMAVLVCSKVAELMHLPGHSPMSIQIARDKKLTRVVTSKAGLPSMRHYTIKMTEDLLPAAEYVMFPAVLKPIIGADSLGVKKVNTLAELQQAFDEGRRVVQSVVISSGLLCTTTEESSDSSIVPMEFLLEEYLDGDEVDIDILLHNGQCFYAAVSDNGETFEPYFTETFGVLPSRLAQDIQQGLIELAIESVKAIGLESGVFHIEAKQTLSRGPRLIEINARLGGGPICEMHKRVYGVDLAAEQIRLACGLSPSFDATTRLVLSPSCCFAYMTTNAISSGRIGPDLSFIETYNSVPGIDLIKVRVKPGDNVVGPQDGQPSWLVEIWMTSGSSSITLVDEICDISDMVAREFEDRYD
jgi:biotin carboxylase